MFRILYKIELFLNSIICRIRNKHYYITIPKLIKETKLKYVFERKCYLCKNIDIIEIPKSFGSETEQKEAYNMQILKYW